MIADYDEHRNLREDRNLGRRQRGEATRLELDDAPDAGGVSQRRPRRVGARFGVAHEDPATQLAGERRHVRPRGVRRWERRVFVGDLLVVKLLDLLQRELLIRPRHAEARPEAEHRPGELMGGHQDVGQRGRGLQADPHFVVDRGVEARPGTGGLVREVGGVAVAHEVLVPAFAPVGCGLPRFRAETAAVHEDHRHVLAGVLRDLKLHVQLVDREVARRARGEDRHAVHRPRGGRVGRHVAPTDVEAARVAEGWRFLFALEVVDGLRRCDGRQEREGERSRPECDGLGPNSGTTVMGGVHGRLPPG